MAARGSLAVRGHERRLALVALPHVPGNPRYLLFLMSVLPVFLADAFAERSSRPWRAVLLGVLIATGALASLAQVPPTLAQDARWRGFVSELERDGVRFCYSDFFLATRINFLSAERVVCSAKLGPFTTEYFFAYRERVEQAPEAALIPVNQTAAARLERRLAELGVTLRATRPREAGAVPPVAQGRPGGALPGAGVPDPVKGSG